MNSDWQRVKDEYTKNVRGINVTKQLISLPTYFSSAFKTQDMYLFSRVMKTYRRLVVTL